MKSDIAVHGGGFSGPVVSQERCDLALIEIDAETVKRWARASMEHFHQVLDLHPQHRAQWVGFEEQLTCVAKKEKGVNLKPEEKHHMHRVALL